MLNYVPIDAVATFDVVTHDPDTGSVHDADSVPVYDVFEDTTDTPILSAQSTTKRTSKTGDYRGSFTASAANGFEADKSYNVVVSATVTGSVSATAITAKKVALTFRAGLAVAVAGVPKADAGYFAGQTITAASGVTLPSSVASPTNLTAGTLTTVTNLTNAPTSGDLTATMKTSVTTAATAATPIAASVTGNVGGNVTGSVGSVVGAVGSVTGAVGSLTTNNDKTGYTLSNTGIDNVLDRTAGVETNFTLRQAMRLMLSSVVAKLSGAATTTITIRDINDTKARITATCDADGNRTAVTTDVS